MEQGKPVHEEICPAGDNPQVFLALVPSQVHQLCPISDWVLRVTSRSRQGGFYW